MTFISYAQNFEDVMLYRALRHVENGFYVDVGAQQPIVDSVTKAFYERGWSGINVEPVPYWYQMLCEDRPRDVNLNLAVGANNGSLRLYVVEGTGLSTAEAEYAERYRQEGRNVAVMDVPVRTLTDVLDEHVGTAIHFLKIDVEGFEREVVAGLDLEKHRPWLLVIEATLPNSAAEGRRDWESTIRLHGYEPVYFDGLNRFYVAKERSGELRVAFSTPPNVFDDFVKYSEWLAHQLSNERGHLAHRYARELHHYAQHADVLGNRLLRAHSELAAVRLEKEALAHERWQLERDANWNRNELAYVQRELDALMRSRSWRMTALIRVVGRAVRAVVRRVRGAARRGLNLLHGVSAASGQQRTAAVQAGPGASASIDHAPESSWATRFFIAMFRDVRRAAARREERSS